MVERGNGIVAEVYSDHAAPATHERAEVAERLRLLEDAEGVRLARHGKIDLVRRFELKEDAGVWATFVKLSG